MSNSDERRGEQPDVFFSSRSGGDGEAKRNDPTLPTRDEKNEVSL